MLLRLARFRGYLFVIATFRTSPRVTQTPYSQHQLSLHQPHAPIRPCRAISLDLWLIVVCSIGSEVPLLPQIP